MAMVIFTFAANATHADSCIHYIECPDAMEECRQQAHEICPKGYHILKEEEVGQDFTAFAKRHFPGAASGTPHILASCSS